MPRQKFEATDSQENWLRFLYIVNDGLFICMLGICAYNLIKYIYPSKDKSTLIVGFYIILVISYILQIANYTDFAIIPTQKPFFSLDHGFNQIDYVELLAESSVCMVGYFIVTTMYHLV